MAGFACVAVLTVLITGVLVNSTTPDNNNVISMLTSSLLKNSSAIPNEEITRARPSRPNNMGNKQKPAERPVTKPVAKPVGKPVGKPVVKPVYGANVNSTEFQNYLEKRISQNKSNGDVNSVEEFWKKRNALADSEVQKLLGILMPLTEKEMRANRIVLSKKYAEFDKAFNTSETFPPSVAFYQAKSLIEQSDIYKIIRKVPKGATLYSELIGAVPLSFMYELTFEKNLYFLFEDNVKFKYSKTRPAPGWRLLSQIRDSENPQYFEDLNEEIKDSLSIIPDPEDDASTSTLREVSHLYSSLTSYKPNFEKTLKTALEILYDDNVMYAELYHDFAEIYDLNGKTYTALEVLRLCKAIVDDFIRTHNGFIGVRFIYASFDRLSVENLSRSRQTVTQLWRANPGLIAGFGVIRMEEDEEPYSHWIEEFLKFPKEIKLFLDAGVTNNWGINADYDLIDAMALNSACIGAGVALNKHPVVLEQIRQKGIPVKSCPTGTQSLGVVSDLRTHPLTLMVATDSPIVIVNVCGTAWNATGLSYDWYEAYMAMTPRFCDLRCLKQFAVNSLLYSTLSNEEKKRSIRAWQLRWDKFIDFVNDNYN